MSYYMYPNPKHLVATVNGRTYSGQSGTPLAVDPADAPALSANGWIDFNSFQQDEVVAFSLLATEVGTAALLQTAVATGQGNAPAGNINWDMSLGYHLAVAMTGNGNVPVPTHIPAAGRAVLVITQNSGSNFPVTFNSAFKFASGANATLTATNGAIDMFVFECDTTRLLCTEIVKNITP